MSQTMLQNWMEMYHLVVSETRFLTTVKNYETGWVGANENVRRIFWYQSSIPSLFSRVLILIGYLRVGGSATNDHMKCSAIVAFPRAIAACTFSAVCPGVRRIVWRHFIQTLSKTLENVCQWSQTLHSGVKADMTFAVISFVTTNITNDDYLLNEWCAFHSWFKTVLISPGYRWNEVRLSFIP